MRGAESGDTIGVVSDGRPTRQGDPTKARAFFIAHEPAYGQPGGKIGGAALVPRMQAEAIFRMDVPVSLVSPQNGHNTEAPMPTTFFEPPSAETNDELLRALTDDEWISYFDKVLQREEDTGLAYGHYYVAGGVMAELRKFRGKEKPLAYMGHSWDRVVRKMDPTRKPSQTRVETEQDIIETSDAIIVATAAEQHMLAGEYGRDGLEMRNIFGKTHVVPLGVDQTVFNPVNMVQLRADHRANLLPEELHDSTIFFLLGRMSPQKNQLEAVRAFADLASQDRRARIGLSLFGGPLDGPYYQQVMDFLATQPDHIRDKVIFHGIVPGHIATAVGDIFLGPSTWETWFLSLSEAMASRKPTIVSDKAILREVGGQGTLFVDEKNPASIANAMHTMLVDEEVREASAITNHIRAREYTWEKSADKLEQAFRIVL